MKTTTMEITFEVARTCGLILCLIYQVCSSVLDTPNLLINTVEVGSTVCDNSSCKYLLIVHGGEFLGHQPWRLTSERADKGSACELIYPNYELKEIETSQWTTKIEVIVPNVDGKIYFCLRNSAKIQPSSGPWIHQGVEHFLEPKKDVLHSQKNDLSDTTKLASLQEELQTGTQITQDLNFFNISDSLRDEDQSAQAHVTTNLNDDNRQETNLNINDLQTVNHKESVDDNNNDQQVANKNDNEIQEANHEWADLSHDTDVNYLPNTARTTREEKNDIEILVNHTFVPLNDIIKEITDNSKRSNVLLSNHNDNVIDNDIKQFVKDNDELLDLNSVNVNYREEYLNFKKLNNIKGIIDKIDLAVSKLIDHKITKKTKHMSSYASLSDRTDFQEKNNIELNDIVFTNDVYNANQKEYTDFDSENMIKKLYNILAKIQEIKCSELQTDTYDITRARLSTKSHRRRRQATDDFTSVRAVIRNIKIEGIRIEDSDKEPKIIEDGIPSVLAETGVTLRVFGEGLTERTVIAFTHDPQPYGQPCKFLLKGEYMVKEGSLETKTALFQIRAPAPITGSHLYICAKNLQYNTDTSNDEGKYIHQGEETYKMLASHNKLLPLWVSICLVLFCLMFSALFSGLNLGLMSLDRTELKIISNTGTEQERKHARAIMPVRDHGNYLLCSILLGNVAVNSTFTILLDELTSGLFAVIFSTLAIVLLGEITPQAICSRHGLMVGARTILITKGVMALTAPLSFPVSKLLDYFLGEEIGNVYNRERLKELVKVTTDVNDLDKDEVNIISGALEMRKKTVKDVMTKLEDVFMLPITSVLDFETMSEIVKSGYSRIPVYEGTRGNIVTVLFIKDLAFVDPDDNTPLRTLCQYYQNAAHFVFEDVTLDIMFKQFKDGHKGHMAFVHRINNEGEGDPFYETIGLVTLEDVIEEMIQSEIVDETDVFLDNRSKRRRRPQNKLQDFAAFAERHENQRIHISPQLTLATFQFLNTSVDAFKPDLVSETVLRRLLKQDVIQYIKIKEKTKRDPETYVYQQGKPVDYFVLILEGRVEVTVGRENLVFEAGPFTYFGVQALTQNVGVAESPTPSAMGSLQNINMDAMLRHTFVPDYSVRAITSLYYLTVKRSLYLAAKRATLMEKGNISKGGQTTQEFDTEVDKTGNVIELTQVPRPSYPTFEKVEVSALNSFGFINPDKLLQSVDEDLSLTGEHKTPSRQVSPHPMPVSPAPRTADNRNGHAYAHTNSDEQERLLK